MTCFRRLLLAFVLTPILTAQVSAQEENSSFQDAIQGLDPMEGFFDLYWDDISGQLLLRIDALEEEFIYQSSLARGVGSNDLLLDRGQLGAMRLVEFQRSGPRILLVEKNLRFRASADNSLEQQAIDSSFPDSVVWGFEVMGEASGSLLVDATDFFLRDSHELSTRLRRAKQGNYSVDVSRSAIFLPRTKAFPDNTEIEAIVTYVGEQQFDADGNAASNTLASVTPDRTSLTVHLHHSFIRLPEPGYRPLPFDPRAGMIPGGEHLDYSSAVGDPLLVQYGRRHRLERTDPGAERSEAVEPIVYWVDSGVPEPIRSALVEGASWWNDAFEAAGYVDAFQVKILPEDVDPMDVRYNVIQWVHRSTRGWSYGSSVRDPRTGEILKGHVTLGSLRVRQDFMIAEGLLAPYGDEAASDAMLEMSLARIRQLSAHEVGHTIGIVHNFAASVNDRSSVMDYPFPLIQFDDNGGLDLSNAYGVGIGEWDRRTVDYAYRDFPEGVDEDAARQDILRATWEDGLLYVADEDSRSPGTAHPHGNLWDNGADAIEELHHLLQVRSYALENFGERNIRAGMPLAKLEETLVPIYLLHRFQIQAVGKLIGGQYFTYALRGDGQALPETVNGDRQRQAMRALLGTLHPDLLALPESLLSSIPPRPPGHPLGRETFARQTGVTFDPVAPAASAASLGLDVLLHLQRAARMNALRASDDSLPGFDELLDELLRATWTTAPRDGLAGAIQRDTGQQVLHRVMGLARDGAAAAQVRAQSLAALQELDVWLAQRNYKRLDADWSAHYGQARRELALMFENPEFTPPATPVAAPPGSPIGGGYHGMPQ